MNYPSERARRIVRRMQVRTSRVIGKPRPYKYGSIANYAMKKVTTGQKIKRKEAADTVRAWRASIK